jgi:hypothetical protein
VVVVVVVGGERPVGTRNQQPGMVLINSSLVLPLTMGKTNLTADKGRTHCFSLVEHWSVSSSKKSDAEKNFFSRFL